MKTIDNNKKFGMFWLPSDLKNKYPGFLSIQEDGNIELEIINPSFLFGKETGLVPRIVGQVEELKEGGYVTLDNCYYYEQKTNNGIFKYILKIKTAFIGVHYTVNEQPYFNTFCFSSESLNQWITNTGIETNTNNINKGEFTIKYKKPKEIIFNLDKGTELMIGHKWHWCGNRSMTQLQEQVIEKVYCKLFLLKEKSVEDLISMAHKINGFLCFVLDDIVHVNNVTVTSDKIKNAINKPKEIKLYYQKSCLFIKNNNFKVLSPLFTFEAIIKNDMEQIFKKWIQLYDETRPAVQLYLLTQTKEYRLLEDRCLNLIKSLEAYHQRVFCTGKKKLSDRLKKVIESLKEWANFNFYKQEQLIKDIVNTRNYLTHYNPKKEKSQEKPVQGTELFELCLKIEGILQLTFIKEMGFSDSIIQSIMTTHNLKNKIQLLQTGKPQHKLTSIWG